jgi:hypothetical protein
LPPAHAHGLHGGPERLSSADPIDRWVADLTDTLQSAGRLAEPPRSAALEVQAGVEVTVRLPIELLARIDEAAAAARGRVHRGDIIRTLLREGLGG